MFAEFRIETDDCRINYGGASFTSFAASLQADTEEQMADKLGKLIDELAFEVREDHAEDDADTIAKYVKLLRDTKMSSKLFFTRGSKNTIIYFFVFRNGVAPGLGINYAVSV